MRHPATIELDRQMKAMFDEIDDALEDEFGNEFSLHPNRCKRGGTANKEMDGLFNVGADFTPGYGSRYGRGYIVQIRISTLEHIPPEIKETITKEVEKLLVERLPVFFPGRGLRLEREGNLLKIVGDFSLGSVIKK